MCTYIPWHFALMLRASSYDGNRLFLVSIPLLSNHFSRLFESCFPASLNITITWTQHSTCPVGRTYLTTRESEGGRGALDFEICHFRITLFGKKGCFLSSEKEKWKFTIFSPTWKKSFRRPCLTAARKLIGMRNIRWRIDRHWKNSSLIRSMYFPEAQLKRCMYFLINDMCALFPCGHMCWYGLREKGQTLK